MRAALVATLLVLLAVPVAAQTPPAPPVPTPAPQIVEPLKVAPIPLLVVDGRFGFASLGTDALTAAGLNVIAANMPGRARTLVAGVHAYPVRQGKWKLGVGAEMLTGSGSSQQQDTNGKPFGPIIRRRLTAVSGQVSLNFGRGRGWSYVTVGGGPMRFDTFLDEAKPTRAGETTTNFGGGARWFSKTHLAFTIDLRFYLTPPASATGNAAVRGRHRITLLSAGISLK